MTIARYAQISKSMSIRESTTIVSV